MLCPKCHQPMKPRCAQERDAKQRHVRIPIWQCLSCNTALPRPETGSAAPTAATGVRALPTSGIPSNRGASRTTVGNLLLDVPRPAPNRRTKLPCCELHPDTELEETEFKSYGKTILKCPRPKCFYTTLKAKRTPKRPHDLVLTAVPLSEHEHQVRLLQEVEPYVTEFPELELLFAVPNGGLRHIIVAKRLKEEGVKPGVPDLLLPVPCGQYPGWFAEMKIEDGGTVSKAQSWWHGKLYAQGFAGGVFHGWKPALDNLLWYIRLPRPLIIGRE